MITSVELLVGIDGLPLFNSSAGELWPILVSILNVPSINSVVIPVRIYFGKKSLQLFKIFLGIGTNQKVESTEFRQFLLYTGPIVLYDVLKPDYTSVYNNFLCLCIIMTILLSPRFCYQHRENSQELLIHFVKVYQKLYGREYMTYNFHGLCHIS